MKFTKETDDAVPFKDPTDDSTPPNASQEGGTPPPARDGPVVQGGHTPSRTHPSPHQTDLPAPDSTRASHGSKELPDGHAAAPFHLVHALSPRMTPLLTENDIMPTEMPSKSPHGELSRHSDHFIQGRKAPGTKEGALLEPEEGSSDMDMSSTSDSPSKYTAKRHSPRSSERSSGSSVVRQYLASPKHHTPHSNS